VKLVFGTSMLLICFVSACNTTGVPTEIANACNADNEKKTLEVSGYLDARTSVYCSNRAGRMECGFDFLDAPGGTKKFGTDIEQGSGANTVDEIKGSYKKEELKIRDNAGNQVAVGTDKVKVTGKMSIEPKMDVCFMQVYKIEK